MDSFVEKYNGFGECILLDVQWKHEGYALEFMFDYIWERPGVLRTDLDQPNPVRVVLTGVHEFHVRNSWTEDMLENSSTLNWGASEVALMRVEDDPAFLTKYVNSGREIHHASIQWEGARRIDIVFRQMEIIAEEECV